jgi:hypothetical protein
MITEKAGPPANTGETLMTLEELEGKLPNGLHDAQLSKLEIDYQLGELTL